MCMHMWTCGIHMMVTETSKVMNIQAHLFYNMYVVILVNKPTHRTLLYSQVIQAHEKRKQIYVHM